MGFAEFAARYTVGIVGSLVTVVGVLLLGAVIHRKDALAGGIGEHADELLRDIRLVVPAQFVLVFGFYLMFSATSFDILTLLPVSLVVLAVGGGILAWTLFRWWTRSL